MAKGALSKNDANFTPLSPLSFLRRAADVFPDKPAIIHGRTISYAEMADRVRRFAGGLAKNGVKRGDVVSVLAPNSPALLEAHYAVPLVGGVLNAINTRLDAAAIAFILEHAESKVLLVDRELADLAREALSKTTARPIVIDADDPMTEAQGGVKAEAVGALTYDALLAESDAHPWRGPDDEWDAICVNYTSGTTGDPKGVVYSHRGAYLNALSNVIGVNLRPDDGYLWTLPMFHCNGWTFAWSVTAAAAAHICLRRVDPVLIYRLIKDHHATKLCAAPVVLNSLAQAPEVAHEKLEHAVEVVVGGAAPPSAVIESMERRGFNVTHAYGLTETYGPSTYCYPQDDWPDLSLDERARLMARQGVRHHLVEDADVRHPATCAPIPADGQTIGEVMMRGNTVMRGYLKNPKATDAAFAGGWFHSGDLAVKHADGYIEIKDRAKDIIISGGENISSLEVEEALYQHPKVMEAAVVARPDDKWGESPCAFVDLAPGENAEPEEIIEHCRAMIARFKAPRTIVFGPLPKTATGKIQKFVLRERAKNL